MFLRCNKYKRKEWNSRGVRVFCKGRIKSYYVKLRTKLSCNFWDLLWYISLIIPYYFHYWFHLWFVKSLNVQFRFLYNVLFMKCLSVVGGTQSLFFVHSGLFVIYGSSQSLIFILFSTCFSLFYVTLLFMKISDQKQYKKTVLPCFILEIVLACSSCSLEQFLALTSLAPFSGTKLKHILPGFYYSTGFERWTKPANNLDYISPDSFHSGY